MDAEAAESASLSTVRARSALELADERTAEDLRESTSPQPSANESEEEVVLVEAPASAITSSLETLKADEVNYLGIAVDDSAAKGISSRFGARAGADYSTPDQDAFAKKLREQLDWTKFNRGVVPQTEYSLSRDKLYFYEAGTTERIDTGLHVDLPADTVGPIRRKRKDCRKLRSSECRRREKSWVSRAWVALVDCGHGALKRHRNPSNWRVAGMPCPIHRQRRGYSLPRPGEKRPSWQARLRIAYRCCS